MLLLLPIAVGAVAGLLVKGRMVNWIDSPLRWPWIVVVALLVREAVAVTPLREIDALRFVYAAFLMVVTAWALWHVRRIPGIWIVSIGALMNLAAIAANDFRMPVAAAYAGRLVAVGHSGQYTVMDSSTRLAFLGDWIPTPVWLGGVYSPGDVVIGIGAGVAAFLLTAWYRARA